MEFLTFKQFDAAFDTEDGAFKVDYTPLEGGEGFTLMEGKVLLVGECGKAVPLSAFGKCGAATKGKAESLALEISLQEGPPSMETATISIALGYGGIAFGGHGRRLRLEGTFLPGTPASELMSVCLDRAVAALGAVSGPAVGGHDDALFDRRRDLAVFYDPQVGGANGVYYDWRRGRYEFCAVGGEALDLFFEVQEDYIRRRFGVPYRGIRPRRGFETPAAGWMTWYAVKFDACEAVVLENARAFMDLFGAYLDRRPVLWVDWEWCHKALDGLGAPGSDMLTPRKEAYPRGLKPLADDLKAMGFLPALWVGPTNDGLPNEMMKAHPEWVLCQKKEWCGQYWFDLTHPQVQAEVFPKLFKQYLAWGYEALKWDCLPMTLSTAANHRGQAHEPAMPPARQLRRVAQIARRTIGEETYMMSCSGYTEGDIEAAMDSFDGARVGGDIFTWQEFLKEGLDRIRHFYLFHNTAFYVDADNLVLRAEHSTLAQARSRVSIYGLCGLPVTVGDALKALDAPRIDMLRRIMPPIGIRPEILERLRPSEEGAVAVVRLALCRAFGSWTVAALCNTNEAAAPFKCNLADDLGLEEDAAYAVYDYWNRRFVGIAQGALEVEIPPCDTLVLRLTPLERDRPTLLSVSRHITQGGYELEDYTATPQGASGRIRLNPAEPTRLAFLLPEDKRIASASGTFAQEGQVAIVELPAREKGVYDWEMKLAEK